MQLVNIILLMYLFAYMCMTGPAIISRVSAKIADFHLCSIYLMTINTKRTKCLVLMQWTFFCNCDSVITTKDISEHIM